MFDRLCNIAVCDIDLTDERYKISFSADDITQLADSIRTAGLIVPPMVRPLDNKFIIVSGFNRIRAQIFNNETHALVYQTKPDISDRQCLLASIAARAFQKPLTHAELILCINRLSLFLDKKQIAKTSCAVFNTQLSEKFIQDLLTIGTLPDPALALIQSNCLTLKSAKQIASYDKKTIPVFLTLFSKIKASSSKQLEIIQYIMEISARDHTCPENVLCSPDFQDIFMDENTDLVLKADQVRTCLYALRFPTISRACQMIREKMGSINLGTIKFVPPENLDSRNFSISFTAQNFKEFEMQIKQLNRALDNKALKELLDQ